MPRGGADFLTIFTSEFFEAISCDDRFCDNTAGFQKFKCYDKLVAGNNGQRHQTPKSGCLNEPKVTTNSFLITTNGR